MFSSTSTPAIKGSVQIASRYVHIVHCRFNYQQVLDISDQIISIKHNRVVSSKEENPATIFHGLLDSTLPSNELSTERLTEEGLTVIGAGTVTTAHTLAVIFFHLLSNSYSMKRVQEELSSACHQDQLLNWTRLAKLPFLCAVINEGLRLSFGVSHRLQRISPDLPLTFQEWTIPAGTPVSQTQMFILLDPEIFPRPDEFLPDRWLPAQERKEDIAVPEPRDAKKYLIPFSRGSRSCLGMNLAYAELFLTVGSLLRPKEMGGLEMKLFETGPEEMVIEHDFFNPSPGLGAKGIRVLIL
jgi:cytochrome P450